MLTVRLLWLLGGYHRGNGNPRSNLNASVLACLKLNCGRICTHDQITDYVWGCEEDGGPVDPQGCVAVAVCHLRQRGWNIEIVWGRGYKMLKIDKDMPLPAVHYNRPSRFGVRLTDLSGMEVGDSFFLLVERADFQSCRTYIYGLARQARVAVLTRMVYEDGKQGLRVWRVAGGEVELPPALAVARRG